MTDHNMEVKYQCINKVENLNEYNLARNARAAYDTFVLYNMHNHKNTM
jgi:hypothetical protein